MNYLVSWYDGPRSARRKLGGLKAANDAREHVQPFERVAPALQFARDLLVSGGAAYDVTLTLPDGKEVTGVPLSLRLRDDGLLSRTGS